MPFRLTFEAHGSPAPKGNVTFTRADGSFTAGVARHPSTQVGCHPGSVS
jgi:hypothetical protein